MLYRFLPCVVAIAAFNIFSAYLWAQDDIQLAGAVQDVVMKPIDLEAAATCMEMSEDGKFLVIGHENDNLVTVYDVTAGVVSAEIECPAPRNVL